MKRPIPLDTIRQHIAAAGIAQDRDPRDFSFHADISGLTAAQHGYDRFYALIHRLRSAANKATGGDYALCPYRCPKTHQKLGMRVYAADQETADWIVQNF